MSNWTCKCTKSGKLADWCDFPLLLHQQSQSDLLAHDFPGMLDFHDDFDIALDGPAVQTRTMGQRKDAHRPIFWNIFHQFNDTGIYHFTTTKEERLVGYKCAGADTSFPRQKMDVYRYFLNFLDLFFVEAALLARLDFFSDIFSVETSTFSGLFAIKLTGGWGVLILCGGVVIRSCSMY